MSELLPSPTDMGLPEKFSAWRNKQDEALLRAVTSDKRFIILALPTGAGKSAVYIGAALLNGGRTAVLTSTKGLQQQLMADFTPAGLVDIRGQNNYLCTYPHLDPQDKGKTTVDHGPCHGGMKCGLKQGGCPYYDAVELAKNSAMVSTNYSYWMHSHEHGQGLGHFQMLVLDECHDSVQELSDYLSVQFTPHDIEGLCGHHEMPDTTDFAWWKAQAASWHRRLALRLAGLKEAVGAEGRPSRNVIFQIKSLSDVIARLSRLADARGEWVVEVARRGPMGRIVAKFDPVWPADYAEEYLFHGITRVVMTSATVRPKTLELLGVRETDVDFVEYPSVFPVSRRPVYLVPTVKMDKRATPEHKRLWMSNIDAIIRTRLDRKGIIHTVSYDRANYIVRNSEFADAMMVHETRTAQQVIRQFKQMDPPAILVSPSVTTGYDFPMEECAWQIIAKVPFPDARDKVLAARTERDKDYAAYLTMQTMVQAAGRGMRSSEDTCEVLVVDDNATWFLFKHKAFAPQWFLQSVKRVAVIPKPLEFSSRSKSQTKKEK